MGRTQFQIRTLLLAVAMAGVSAWFVRSFGLSTLSLAIVFIASLIIAITVVQPSAENRWTEFVIFVAINVAILAFAFAVVQSILT
jgi:hypothetical protein